MNFNLRSYWLLTSVVGIFFLVAGTSCVSESELPTGDQEVSLEADRTSLEELRQEIPEQKRRENDELALILQVMNAKDRPPIEVRERFNTLMRRKREDFNKYQKRVREDFTRQERDLRTQFYREQSDLRTKFERSKSSASDRRSNSQDLAVKRERFEADNRDRRKQFEEDMRARELDFSALVTSKNKEFDEHYKSYSKEYKERKDLEAVKDKTPPQRLESQ